MASKNGRKAVPCSYMVDGQRPCGNSTTDPTGVCHKHRNVTIGKSNRRTTAAAKQAAIRADELADQTAAGPQPWQERPVSISELKSAMTAAGCGKKAHLAPLVELTQGPDGLTFTTVASAAGADIPDSGALEIRDPFACSDVERNTEVNGRFLQDAIRAHDNAALKGMTAADLAIGEDGTVRVGDVEVCALDGTNAAIREARDQLESLRECAEDDGVTLQATRGRLHQELLESHRLTDEDAYVDAYIAQCSFSADPHESMEQFRQWREENRDKAPISLHLSSLELMRPRDAELLPDKFGQEGGGLEYDDWLRKEAREAYQQELRLASQRYEVGLQANVMHLADVREWAIQRGHDYDGIKAAAERPQSADKYRGVTEQQRVGLAHAKELLRIAGEPAWEPRATVQGFGDELGLILAATSKENYRPILTGVHFSDLGGRPRMVANDSYRLMTSTMNVPRALVPCKPLIPGRDLSTWRKVAGAHVGRKAPPTQLGIAANHPDAQRPVIGLHAGQMRVASQGIAGEYPSYEVLFPDPDPAGSVTINASDLLGVQQVSKGTRYAPVRLSLQHSETGGSDKLGWFVREQGDDYEMHEAGGSVPAVAPLPRFASDSGVSDELAVNPEYLRDSLRLASGSPRGGTVEMRRWHQLKPMLIVPEGAPADWREADRAALTMPVRVS